MHAHSLPDAQLIRQSQNGDQAAYGQLVERYQSLVCSVAYNRCGDLAQSEDLAQEAFIQAWRKLADLHDIAKFKAWICTIVRNLAHRAHEQSNRNVSSNAARLDSVSEPTSVVDNPAERVVSVEQEQLVWQALAEVPENYREPMILFYREEQSVARVADALELSQDAVKQRLSRGRKMLQEHLAATVETALKNSKPSKAFTGAVVMGVAGAKAKTAAAGVATSVGVNTAIATGTGVGGMFLMQIAQLPVLAWLFKMSLDETRSPRERQMMLRHQAFWMVVGALMALPMFASIPWQHKLEPRWMVPLIPTGFMILLGVPMTVSSRRLSKRIEQLRLDEKTATPIQPIVADTNKRHRIAVLCVGSGLLIAVWPAIMPFVAGDWTSVAVLLTSAIAISLFGARLCGSLPTKSFQMYAFSLAAIALVGIGVMYFRRDTWIHAFSNHLIWFMGLMQAMAMTHVILTIVVWKRVYGKPNS